MIVRRDSGCVSLAHIVLKAQRDDKNVEEALATDLAAVIARTCYSTLYYAFQEGMDLFKSHIKIESEIQKWDMLFTVVAEGLKKKELPE